MQPQLILRHAADPFKTRHLVDLRLQELLFVENLLELCLFIAYFFDKLLDSDDISNIKDDRDSQSDDFCTVQ